MGFFRKTSKARNEQKPVLSPQEQYGAGRQAAGSIHAYQTQLAPYRSSSSTFRASNGMTFNQAYQPHLQQHGPPSPYHNGMTTATTFGTVNSAHDDDFDDAASYHSISSNPGIAQSAGPYTNDGTFTPAMTSRYDNSSGRGRSTTQISRLNTESYYGTPGDENYFCSAGVTPNAKYSQHPLATSPAIQTEHSYRLFSPSSAQSAGRMSALHERLPKKTYASTEEMGEDYFQTAVKFHEEGDLASATAYFKRAADAQNPLGMLFYGLSLRHGWGCQPNENMAFVFLQKSGEIVVPLVKDMDPAVAGMAREELAMAIYELGQSYRHGWGVSQNKKTAVYYFEVAADLGDADAQADLAACYEKGDGVKRDKKKAAHYYRLAHKQGNELFGTSWIFKKKYDSD
ncbi:hypothetical protein BX667DRAFT_530989 [Coemansia mojavensis]|nr:hypothetical protein BX667DRAFT_530989 [Coemansia mojavensis]